MKKKILVSNSTFSSTVFFIFRLLVLKYCCFVFFSIYLFIFLIYCQYFLSVSLFPMVSLVWTVCACFSINSWKTLALAPAIENLTHKFRMFPAKKQTKRQGPLLWFDRINQWAQMWPKIIPCESCRPCFIYQFRFWNRFNNTFIGLVFVPSGLSTAKP